MFQFKLRSVPDRFLVNRDVLDTMNDTASRFLLVTGGTGTGKTTLIDKWLDHLEKRAKATGRPLMTIRFTPNMPDAPNAPLNYLSGKLNIKEPKGSSTGWIVSLNPKIKVPPFIKLDFKLEGNRPVQAAAGESPIDQQASNARAQLERVAGNKNSPIPFLGKVPIVAVTIEKLTSPELLGEIKQVFDANTTLPLDNKIHFLVSGNLNLHQTWWKQRANEDGLMTQFADFYLGHIWSLYSFCEQAIDTSTISDRKLLPKFANYLAIESNGRLRQAWELLAQLSKTGIEEEVSVNYFL